MGKVRSVRNNIVVDAAVNAVSTLRANHGPNIYDAYYRKKKTHDGGGLKVVLPAEDRMTEHEMRLAHGLIEAMVCYAEDAKNFGTVDAEGMPTVSKLVGVGTAEDLTGIVRQRIQDLCNKGFLPHIEEPYHRRKLIVRAAVMRLAKDGNPNLRGNDINRPR